jgi:hypothetical protein
MDHPFESLTKGIDKDASLAFKEANEHPAGVSQVSTIAVALTNGVLPYFHTTAPQKTPKVVEQLSDRFLEPLAVFPLSDRIIINKYGAFVPKTIFGSQTEITYRENRTTSGSIRISIWANSEPLNRNGTPQFGSARGLIRMSDDFDDPLDDFADYM